MLSAMTRILLSWSSGKDSAHALAVLRSDPAVEVAGLLTTVTADYDRVSMHGARKELLEAQARATGLPLRTVEIPPVCTNDDYEVLMRVELNRAAEEGIEAIAFGDLYLEDIRDYRLALLEGTGLAARFPLWQRPTRALAEEMQSSGLRAKLCCIDPKVLGASFAGRDWDASLIHDLPEGADPCGENGEFHTFVYDAPVFAAPIPIQVGETVERGGFVFADLLPGKRPDDAVVARQG